MPVGVIKPLANLPNDVLHVPDREALMTCKSSRNRVALNVFSGRKKKVSLIAHSIEGRNVVAVERFCAFGFIKNSFQEGRAVLYCVKANYLQRDVLLGVGVNRFVNSCESRLRKLTNDFEMANFFRHSALPAKNKK